MIDVDLSVWNQAVKELGAVSRKTTDVVLKTENRLLIKQIMDFTPPKNMGQGRNAVKGDLEKIFLGYDETPAWLNIGGKEVPGLWFKKDGVGVIGKPGMYQGAASRSTMRKHHLDHRSQRTGHVIGAGKIISDGKWETRPQMIVTTRALKDYLKYVWDAIGWMKSGWAPALRMFGGAMPKWVSRHSLNPGWVKPHFEGPVGYIESTNTARGITRMDRRIKDAVKSRLVKMQLNYDRQLRQALKRTKHWYK